MFNGGTKVIFVSALVLSAVSLGACRKEAAATPAADRSNAATAGAVAAVKHFGPDGFGKLTLSSTETEALASGELQPSPVSTVLGKNVYSFVGGPQPDPKRMAADQKIEDAVAAADKKNDTSAAGSAKAAKAYADSTQRLVERMEALLTAGGAAFRGGKLDSIAAPAGVTTDAGVRRGSTLTELKAAYSGQDLKEYAEASYRVPVAGHAGWFLQFELAGDTVKYMSLLQAG